MTRYTTVLGPIVEEPWPAVYSKHRRGVWDATGTVVSTDVESHTKEPGPCAIDIGEQVYVFKAKDPCFSNPVPLIYIEDRYEWTR